MQCYYCWRSHCGLLKQLCCTPALPQHVPAVHLTAGLVWHNHAHPPNPLARLLLRPSEHVQHGDEAYHEFEDDASGSSSESGSSSTSSEESTGLAAKIVSCLSIIRASSAGEDELGPHRGTPRAHYHHQQSARSHKLPAGCTVPVSSAYPPPSIPPGPQLSADYRRSSYRQWLECCSSCSKPYAAFAIASSMAQAVAGQRELRLLPWLAAIVLLVYFHLTPGLLTAAALFCCFRGAALT